MKFRTALVASACAALALGAASTSTARVIAQSHISIHRDIPLFHGLVKSGESECVPNRKVTLFRKLAGPDKKVGVDYTSHHGRWEVDYTGHLIPGRSFYAKVGLKTIASGGTGLSCAPAKSKTVTFIGE